jgi:heat shock protein HslJ
MKHFFGLAIASTLYVFAFAQNNSPHFVSKTFYDETTLAGTWVLQPVLASDTAAGKFPTITFDLASKKFSGNTGCNDMSGHFFVKGDSLSFDEHIVLTRKACEGYNEKAFIDNLAKTTGYKIVDGVLQLMNDQTVLSKWTRKADTTSKNKV